MRCYLVENFSVDITNIVISDISNDEVKDNPLQKTQKRKMPSKKTENSEKLAKISKNELVKEGTKRKRKRKKQRNKKEIKN